MASVLADRWRVMHAMIFFGFGSSSWAP